MGEAGEGHGEKQLTEEAMNVGSIGFWTVNFWGLLGTFSGIAGLIISYFAFRYKKPSICVDGLKLNYSKLLLQYYSDEKSKGYFSQDDPYNCNSFIHFDLYFNIANKSGGAGSIQKPKLIIRELQGKGALCTTEPITSWYSMRGFKDLGKTIYVNAGERMDRVHLEYQIHDIPCGKRLLKERFLFRYYVSFDDNEGKNHEKEIVVIQAV